MRAFVTAACGLLLLTGSFRILASPQDPSHAARRKGTQGGANKKTNADEGEQRFRQNCGRCHNAPDAISPRKVKAVLRHMRVRAMLSAEDERLILKFLAP